MSSVDAKDRLILALDVASAEEAVHLLDRIGEAISFVKIGLELYTVAGPEMIKHARLRKKRIFLDLKFLDIEETVKRATARAAARSTRKARSARPRRARTDGGTDTATLTDRNA